MRWLYVLYRWSNYETIFYNGIEDTQELIEGIIFFANSEMHKLYANLREQYDASNTKQLLQMKNIAYKCGLQYYRFIELNKDTYNANTVTKDDEYDLGICG